MRIRSGNHVEPESAAKKTCSQSFREVNRSAEFHRLPNVAGDHRGTIWILFPDVFKKKRR